MDILRFIALLIVIAIAYCAYNLVPSPWTFIIITVIGGLITEYLKRLFEKPPILDEEKLGKEFARETQKLKEKEKYLKILNDEVFKLWINVKKHESEFQIEISIDENIDTVLLKEVKSFLKERRKKYGPILDLRKKITELKKNYNRIGEDIITNINAQFSIAYPSLKSIEARKVTGSENCYVIEAINFLIWYRLKKNFLKTGLVKWDNILLEEKYEDNIWRLMSNFAWRFFIQSKNKSDVNEEYFMTKVEHIIIIIISEDLKQQSNLYEELDQYLTEFKNKVHSLSIDIELNRV